MIVINFYVSPLHWSLYNYNRIPSSRPPCAALMWVFQSYLALYSIHSEPVELFLALNRTHLHQILWTFSHFFTPLFPLLGNTHLPYTYSSLGSSWNIPPWRSSSFMVDHVLITCQYSRGVLLKAKAPVWSFLTLVSLCLDLWNDPICSILAAIMVIRSQYLSLICLKFFNV